MRPAARLQAMARCAAAAALLVVSAAVAGPVDAQEASGWSLRRPSAEKAVFRGLVSHDSAGIGMGSMLYPAPNAIGFLAAILTHGLLNESAKKSQKDKLQAAADAVLQPYGPTLEGLTYERLFIDGLSELPELARPRLIGADDRVDGDAVIETAPIFMMPADQRALVLDNVMRVIPPGGGEGTTHVVRVISAPLPEADAASAPSAAWLVGGGAPLGRVSAALLAESIAIVVKDAAAKLSVEEPQRTFRFPLGGLERMERAQLLEERCDRLLLRTLRGHLMSVPVRKPRCP